ncbi:uncharacterized protein LOC110459576 [Mizuhopecten yessoensis]|uniref:Uncharacterized protein n=1 Tax=Mizuhopecten yessoensis TaxID=6573 RepID=A0A210Q492_MIZYE|nr:uncharacterized protein LOC110459576 [Mizuhopecten yessoensis]OWF43554.1 hypothetical protein KP79_PYT08486 [Mizuhopecten yessoensis]
MNWLLAAAGLLTIYTLRTVLCHTITTETGAGYHCMNVTQAFHQRGTSDADQTDLDPHEHCVPCFFPQNCLDNNTCAEGSYGISCEKCDHRDSTETEYHRVGNHCVRCLSGPWSALIFGVFVLILVLISLINGFTVSVCTKIKIVLHFCQFLLLTFMLKITWPALIPAAMSLLTFAFSNADFLAINCLFPKLSTKLSYYLTWMSSFLPPVIIIVFMAFVDKSMGFWLSQEKDRKRKERQWRRRSMLRRITFYLLVATYLPVTLFSAQSNSCSHSAYKVFVIDTSENVFLHDQSLDCDTFDMSTLEFVAILFMIYSVFLPLAVVLFSLIQRKRSLLEDERLKHGSVYESYKSRYCFWEAIPMLRKIVHIAMTETNVISISVQVIIQMTMTGTYVLCLVVLRPYSQCQWERDGMNINLALDVTANLVVGILQAVAFLTVRDMYVTEMTYVFFVSLAIVLVLALGLLLFIPKELEVPEVMSIQADVEEEEAGQSEGHHRFKNKVGPAPSTEQAKQNLQF